VRHDDLYVTSEFPLGAPDAKASLRRYDIRTGASIGEWSLRGTSAFRSVEKPRGIAFSEDGRLLICAQNCVAVVDTEEADGVQVIVEDERLAGQSLALVGCP
jgi:hypothetical protein